LRVGGADAGAKCAARPPPVALRGTGSSAARTGPKVAAGRPSIGSRGAVAAASIASTSGRLVAGLARAVRAAALTTNTTTTRIAAAYAGAVAARRRGAAADVAGSTRSTSARRGAGRATTRVSVAATSSAGSGVADALALEPAADAARCPPVGLTDAAIRRGGGTYALAVAFGAAAHNLTSWLASADITRSSVGPAGALGRARLARPLAAAAAASSDTRRCAACARLLGVALIPVSAGGAGESVSSTVVSSGTHAASARGSAAASALVCARSRVAKALIVLTAIPGAARLAQPTGISAGAVLVAQTEAAKRGHEEGAATGRAG